MLKSKVNNNSINIGESQIIFDNFRPGSSYSHVISQSIDKQPTVLKEKGQFPKK